MTELVTVPPQVNRDRWGRPLIVPPEGGKPVAYTRCTTYVDALEDKYNLQKWQQRMVVLGLADRPDLLLSAAAHRDDKKRLNGIADDAIEAAKAHAAATIGTAIHALTERVDRGEDPGQIPGEYQADIDAYRAATTGLKVLHSETFTVLDGLRIGGTPDRVVEFEGGRYIADIKTGSIEWGIGKICMQLAVYAHSQMYDLQTAERTPLPGVDQNRGIVIHLPAGTGTCTLHWVDLAAGWEAVQLATQVRSWRARKGLATPMVAGNWVELGYVTAAGLVDDPITAQIQAAPTPAALYSLYEEYRGRWTSAHTAAAAARKQNLAQTA